MKITGLNLDIFWKNPRANFEIIEKEFAEVQTDVILLPEMFSTGFCMDAAEIADDSGETLSWMKALAKAKDAAVAGSISVKENGKFFNRFYFVKPDGCVDFYDKRHLFSYSGEDKIYQAGTQRKVVEFRGIRFLLQVCYDLRFPVFSRNRDDYEAILFVANWPQNRVDAWRSLLKARAIENLAFVFGLNRIGTDGNQLFYEESSHAFFADGSEISEKSGNLITADFDLAELQKFREKFHFLQDRDDFDLILLGQNS